MARQSPKKSPTTAPGHIRIISGRWRGRKLPVLSSEGLRPTTDRVKEMLFNWLQGDVGQARCLDLFAGSGGLSFEALSRGADCVMSCELDAKAAAQLTTNRQTMKISPEQLIIHQQNALNLLAQGCDKPFDLVFIDPPFHKNLVSPCCELLSNHQWLAKQALIYIETESNLTQLTLPSHWQLLKQKKSGQVVSSLYLVE